MSGRPKKGPAELPAETEGIDTQAAAQMLADGRVAVRQIQAEDLAELCELAGSVKAIQMADMTSKFCAAAQIQLFKRVRESKKIKDLPMQDAAGNLRRAQTLEEFCPLAFGRSYRSMMEAEERFDLLGEEAYNTANRLGINRSALRVARALPPEKLEVVRTAIAAGSAKAEVLSVIEDLAVKVAKTEEERDKAREDLAANEEVLKDKNQRIDKLLAAQKRIQKLPPDEVLKELISEAAGIVAETRGYINGRLRQAVITLRNHGEDRNAHDDVLAGTVGQVQRDLLLMREEFHLPDVVGDGRPEWQRWADEQDARDTQAAGKAKG